MLNQQDYCVGMLIQLRMMVTNELSSYTINSDGSDGCNVCFVLDEYVSRENGCRLDGATIHIIDAFKSDIENHSMRRHITTIVVTHMKELSMMMIDCYN